MRDAWLSLLLLSGASTIATLAGMPGADLLECAALLMLAALGLVGVGSTIAAIVAAISALLDEPDR